MALGIGLLQGPRRKQFLGSAVTLDTHDYAGVHSGGLQKDHQPSGLMSPKGHNPELITRRDYEGAYGCWPPNKNEVFEVPWFLQCGPSLDALRLLSNVKKDFLSRMKQ